MTLAVSTLEPPVPVRRPAEPVRKRSVKFAGHKTSVSVEEPFWRELRAIARDRETTLSLLIASIDHAQAGGNLSSKLRLFVLRQVLAHGPAGDDDDDETASGRDRGEPWSR